MKKSLPILLFFINCSFCLFAQPAIQWQKTLGGSGDDGANSIKQTSDGGYIVAGYSGSKDGDAVATKGNHGGKDYWIVRLNSSGDTLWQKSYGGTLDDEAQSVQPTSDGGYIVAGYSNSANGNVLATRGNNDYWILKLNSTGTIAWQKSLGGSLNDYAYTIQQTLDGGYIVVGATSSNNDDVSGNHGGVDCWVVKLDGSGNVLWKKCYGGTGDDYGYDIHQTADSGYIIAGQTNSDNGDVSGNHKSDTINTIDCWVLKINSTGTLQWQKSLGGSGSDYAHSIQQTSDGGYIVGAYTNSTDGDVSVNYGSDDYWVIKLDTGGNIKWQKSYGGSGTDQGWSIHQTTDNGYIFAGQSNSLDGEVTLLHGNNDYWVIKLDTAGKLIWEKTLGGTGDDNAYSIQETSDFGCIIAGVSNSSDGDVTLNHADSIGNPSNDFWIVKLSAVVGIEEKSNPLSQFQISPNPVCQSATVSFSLSQPENVLIKIYDITGRVIKTLDQGNLNQGIHILTWNVGDDKSSIDSGIYLLTVETPDASETQRVAVIR